MTPRTARASLLVATASWGLTFIANHQLLHVVTPPTITLLRFGLVSCLLGLVIVATPSLRPRFTGREWALLAVCGVLAVPGSQLALTHGQRFLSPAMSGLVVATGPAFAAVLAVAFLGERLTRRARYGIGLAFVGAAVVIVFATGTGTDLTVRNPAGAALVALAQLCWAAFTVLSKGLVTRHPPITVMGVTVILGTLALLPFAPVVAGEMSHLDGGHALWFVHLAVFGTAVPYLIWGSALRPLAANETAVFMFLIPLFAVAWSALLVGERPAAVGLLGGCAIVAGVMLTQVVDRRPSPRGGSSPAPEVPPP